MAGWVLSPQRLSCNYVHNKNKTLVLGQCSLAIFVLRKNLVHSETTAFSVYFSGMHGKL